MGSICGADCSNCGLKENCKGCKETSGCPFGKRCFIADYIKVGGIEAVKDFKCKLIDEFNDLKIPGMPKVNELYALAGSYVNLEYMLPSGVFTKILDDNSIYLGSQLECEFGGDRCYGIVANNEFLLVCQYGVNGSNPEIVMYKRR